MTMQKRSAPRLREGFTLVELLVVIAIIGILASIVVPNVTRYIQKSRVAKAQSEIRSAETSLTGMLADAGVSRFRDFLRDPVGVLNSLTTLERAQGFYQDFFYILLRQGRNALSDPNIGGALRPEIVNKLGEAYMDIGADPWGNQYRFWMGQQRNGLNGQMMHRSFRMTPGFSDPLDPDYVPYIYDAGRRTEANAVIPGNPSADNLPGFPAPRNIEVYIHSLGPNELNDAFYAIQQTYTLDPAFLGGGDDPNNWDNEQGHLLAPR